MQGAVHAWQAVFRHMVNYRNVEIIGTSAEMGDSLRGYGKALSASDAIMLVCYVIARVQIPLQTFCVDFSMVPGDHDLIPCIHPRHVSHAFLRRSPDFLAAWSNTRSLILRGALRGDLFAGLMMHTGRLEKLELTKCWWPDLGNTFHVLKLLGRSLQLREFRLEWSDASQHALATLLKQVKPSLRKLYPGHLKLRWGSWIPILTQLRARNTTILEEISLIELSSVGFVKSQLHFPRLSSNAVVDPETGSEVTYSSRVVGGGFGRCLNTGIRYSGPRMDIALQRLPDWGQEASFS
ncbi:hypothetical protein BJY00DRAFT_311426 [Aspergillus carlsbadensis]|nr:hypothetical protein BJY00DRAFT_311426 [Aspergillus carlsbadensis]